MPALKLRPYQERVVTSVQDVNAIVKMPTGSGKTAVAAEVINRHITKEHSRRVLFLVPGVELVNQQAEEIRNWCFPDDIAGRESVYTHQGGLSPPTSLPLKGILVVTHGAFTILQESNPNHFGWSNFSLCIFDEVHHAIREHLYRKIALQLSNYRKNNVLTNQSNASRDHDDVQVLCLSASLTYAVSEKDIEKAINQLCAELNIQQMVSPTSSELLEGGYVPPSDDCIQVEVSHEVPEGVVPLYHRKNHEMYDVFMKRVKSGEATELSLKVFQVIQDLERIIQASLIRTFASPVLSDCKLKSWEECAHGLAEDYRLNPKPKLLETWYVALRVLVQTWEEDEDIVIQWLMHKNAFNVGELNDQLLVESVQAVKAFSFTRSERLKVSQLRNHLVEKKEKYGDGFRCIIFVQQQITAYILSQCVLADVSQLNGQVDIKAGYVVSRGSKITPSIKFNKTQADKTIEKFRRGDINVLVATSVIEEGFDVPAANVVICYDPLKDSVELCQRFGRARQEDRSIVVLDQRRDRPLHVLRSIQTLQDDIVQKFDPNNVVHDEEFERTKQKQRDSSAYKSILSNSANYQSDPLKRLNEFVQKTKGTLNTEFDEVDREHFCELKYSSCLRNVLGSGCSIGKKNAKNQAALEVLDRLRQDIGRLI